MYKEENDNLLKSFLNRTFFTKWRNMDTPGMENFSRLELMFKGSCNLNCAYCYLNHYGDKLYPPEYYADEEQLLKNLESILDWVYSNNMNPQLEYFSGEALIYRSGIRGLELILDKWKEYGIKSSISIPTNYTFLLSGALTKKIETLIDTAENLGGRIFLSASFDGKHMETNRPFTHGVEMRDDAYYDKAFAFVKKHDFGFHPMIYSKGIDLWRENFLWFQDMLKKHDIPWYRIYLLEVRNAEWSQQQIKQFGKFVGFLINWSWDMCDHDVNKFTTFIFKNRGFNILSSPLSTTGRGLGCSLQSVLYVRIGDMSIVPCHRTCYDIYKVGHFEVEEEKITDIKADNVEFYLSEMSLNGENLPYCEHCMINCLCSYGCLGAQFETTGDPFTPIPTVCQLEYEKIATMIRAYKNIGVFEVLMNKVNPCIRKAFKQLEEQIYGESD